MADIITTAAASATTNLGAPSVPAKPERVGSGLHFERHFTKPGVSPLRRAHLGEARRRHPGLQGQDHLRAEGRRDPQLLVHDRDQHRRVQVPPRPGRHARARVRRPRPRLPRRRVHPRLGHPRRLLRLRTKTPTSSSTSSATSSLNQKAAFNSPVWFNVGCDRLEPNSDAHNWHWDADDERDRLLDAPATRRPQCSACFINSVDDSLDCILTLAKTEGMLFKWGSGAGSNLSHDPRLHGDPLRRRHRLRPALASCAASTPSPASSSPAARPAAPPRWSSSTSTIPTSSTSSSARSPKKRKAWTLMSAGYDGSGPDSEAFTSHLLPERQQLRPRHRRVHERRRQQRHLLHPARQGRRARQGRTAPATSCTTSPKPPGSAATPACSTTPPSTAGTPARTPRASTRPIPARSTCSSTTPPATSPAST